MKHSVVLLLGSNINKERNIPEAIRLLAEATTVVAVSDVYESSPVGSSGQSSFFNVAVLIHTEEPADRLKEGLIGSIERKLHRVRQADINAPRTIDIDIVLFDDAVFEYTPDDGKPRRIPDPDLLRYAHCALPVADLLPERIHPETGEPLKAIAGRLVTMTENSGDSAIQRRTDISTQSFFAGN